MSSRHINCRVFVFVRVISNPKHIRKICSFYAKNQYVIIQNKIYILFKIDKKIARFYFNFQRIDTNWVKKCAKLNKIELLSYASA